MTDPAASEPTTTPAAADPEIEPAARPAPPTPGDVPAPFGASRLRRLGALAVASMLVAGGLLMALGGVSRLVHPAPATLAPASTVGASPAPLVTPAPTTPRLPSPPRPSGSPQGDVAPRPAPGWRTGDAPAA